MKALYIYKIGYQIKGKKEPEKDYIWTKAPNVKEAKEGAKSFVYLRISAKKKGGLFINKYMKSLTFFVMYKSKAV